MAQITASEKSTKYSRYIPFLDHNYNLVMLLGLTVNSIDRTLQQHARMSGLTASEYSLLILVKELGDRAIPAELSRILLKRPPAITTLLNRMEKRGIVNRKTHPDNNNAKIVVMTEKGRRAFEAARQRHILNEIIGEMTPEKYELLWDLLEELKDRAVQVGLGLPPYGPALA